jgi:beta-N-acetylhexosaminidase
MPGHLRVPELTGDLPATLSPAAITGLLRGELGYAGVVICDALEMKAASALYGIPEAAVLAMIAGVDLLCLGRDTDEAMYHSVREAIADAVTSGRLPAARLEEAAGRVTALRTKLSQARRDFTAPADTAYEGIGLIAARRALRGAGAIPARLHDPLVIEVEPEENIAAGRFTWGFSPWTAVNRVDAGAGDGAAVGALVSQAAGRSLVLAVRNALAVQPLVSDVLTARPDAIIVEMGVPAWTPPEGTAYLSTYGASRACSQAAAEALGMVLSRSPGGYGVSPGGNKCFPERHKRFSPPPLPEVPGSTEARDAQRAPASGAWSDPPSGGQAGATEARDAQRAPASGAWSGSGEPAGSREAKRRDPARRSPVNGGRLHQ